MGTRRQIKPQCLHPSCLEWSPGAKYLSKDCQTAWGFTRQDDESRVGDGVVGHAGSAKMTVLTCLTQILWLQLAARRWHVCRACELDITGFRHKYYNPESVMSVDELLEYDRVRRPRWRSDTTAGSARCTRPSACCTHLCLRGGDEKTLIIDFPFFIRKSQALRTRGRKGEKTFDLFNHFINDGRIDSSPLPICQGMAWIQELYRFHSAFNSVMVGWFTKYHVNSENKYRYIL